MTSSRNGRSADLAVELHDASGLADLKHEWIRLFDEVASDNPFLTFEWADATCRHLPDREKPVIAVARDGGRVVGIAPMKTVRVRPLGKRLEFLGPTTPDFGGFLVRSEDGDLTSAALWDLLLGGCEFDRVQLLGLREGSACLPPTRAALSRAGDLEEEAGPCYLFIDLEGGADSYFKGRSRSMRKGLSRARNRLERDGVEARLWRSESVSEDCLSAMLDMGASRWRAKTGTSMYNHPNKRAVFLDLADSFSRCGWLDVAGIDLAGELAAFQVGFRIGGVFYAYNTGFDLAREKYAPGKLLLEYVVRGCFDAGLRRVDFMAGAEPAKEEWATGRDNEHRLSCRLPGFAVRHALQDAVIGSRAYARRVKDRSSILKALWRKASRLG